MAHGLTPAEPNTLTEQARTIFLDGGSTDSIGIVDVFLYLGTFVLATVTALAILGLIYGASGDSGATGYAQPAVYDTTYSAYDQVYNVARHLYTGYKNYEEARSSSS